jgi:isoquinoline 1-oxidoreductase beta subunit
MALAVDRKDFLRIVVLGGAGLTLGLELAPARSVAAAANANGFSPVAWLRMGTDGITTVIVNQVEMGQGITTALSMCVAEELDVPMSSVRFELSPTEPKYYNPSRNGMGTGGSQSTPTMSPVMRNAGATARAMLVSAAATKWGVDPATCTTSDGVVSAPGGQKAAYVDLLASAASVPVPARVTLKAPGTFKILGTRQRRLDATPKTNGSAVFAMDVRVPGMKYASIEKPVQIGARLVSFDAGAALKFPGVRKAIAVPSGIAVIADNTWAAFQGRKLLSVVWAPGPNAGVSTASIYSTARALSRTPGGVLKSTGDVASPLTGTVVEASYETPYLAHATMEPMNTTADVRADRVTLWTPTQAQTSAQAVAAKITGLPIAAVTLIATYIGGGFGRRGETDYVAEAVQVSKATGLPIQLVWTREDDIRYDTYRPGTVIALAASLAPGGRISTLKQTLVSPSITARLAPSRMKDGVDPAAGNGLTNLAYAIQNQLVDWHQLDVAIPVGYWRAPYANANTFVIESFVDELAHAAEKDPVAFRLALLEAGSRPHVVLERVAKLAKWGTALPAGHARGVAIGQWNGSWIAMVAEVSMPDGQLKVDKMLASLDVGQPINIDGLEQQLESAMSFGLSAALTGKITFAGGGAVQKNFIDYPVLRMADSPQFVCDIVPSIEKSSGAGEIGVPCVAPSIANAIFALNGKRIRTLPLIASPA